MTTALPALTSHIGLILYGGPPSDAARRHASRREHGCNSGALTWWSCDKCESCLGIDLCFPAAGRSCKGAGAGAKRTSNQETDL